MYVESIDSASLTGEQQKNIRANMDLAERLGAQVVALTGDDVATVVSEYARLSGITNIVIGKSRNKRTLKNLFEMDLEDKLIALLPSIEVHIIPSPDGEAGLPPPAKGEAKHALPLFLDGRVRHALAGRRRDASVHGPSDDQFRRPEYHHGVPFGRAHRLARDERVRLRRRRLGDQRFGVQLLLHRAVPDVQRHSAGYPVTFLIMLLVALITSALTVRIKTQARLAVEREHRTDVLYEINKKLLATRGTENIVRLTSDYVATLLNRSIMFTPPIRVRVRKAS